MKAMLQPIIRRTREGFLWMVLDGITNSVLRRGKAPDRKRARRQERRAIKELRATHET